MSRIIEITRDSIPSEGIYFHDAKIKCVKCDYLTQVFTIELDVSGVIGINANSAILTFGELQQLDMSMVKPWGGPFGNINTVIISTDDLPEHFKNYTGIWRKNAKKPDLDSSFHTWFQLISGDDINIVAKLLTIEFNSDK